MGCPENLQFLKRNASKTALSVSGRQALPRACEARPREFEEERPRQAGQAGAAHGLRGPPREFAFFEFECFRIFFLGGELVSFAVFSFYEATCRCKTPDSKAELKKWAGPRI